jgi:putative flippase GtrA
MDSVSDDFRKFSLRARSEILTPEWRQMSLFLAMGLVNALFGYAAFAAALYLGAKPFAALVAAATAGVLFNFQTSRWVVFRSRGGALRFAALYAAILAINWGALGALRAIGLSTLLAQAVVVLPLAALSFLGQRMFVFIRRGP